MVHMTVTRLSRHIYYIFSCTQPHLFIQFYLIQRDTPRIDQISTCGPACIFFLWHGLAPAQCVGRPDPAPTATHLPAASAAARVRAYIQFGGGSISTHRYAYSWQKRRKEATQWGPRIFAMSSMRRERTISHLSMFPLWDMKSIHASRRSVADPLNFLAMNEDSRACSIHEITRTNTYTQTHTHAHIKHIVQNQMWMATHIFARD